MDILCNIPSSLISFNDSCISIPLLLSEMKECLWKKEMKKTKERTRDHLVSFLLKLKNELTIPTHLSTIYLSINSPVRKSKMAYSKRAELANVTKENHWGWRATKRNYEAAAFILFNPRTFSLFFYFFSLFLPLSSVTLRLIYLVHDYRSGI